MHRSQSNDSRRLFSKFTAKRSQLTFIAAGLSLLSSAAIGCSEESGSAQESVRSVASALSADTDQLVQKLQSGNTGGQFGFILKRVGGPVVENFNENLQYDPASSIKILVALRLLTALDAGASFTLDTTTTYFNQDPNGCPSATGPSQPLPLRTLLLKMLENSDNVATRALIDFVGGFSQVQATAQSLGMTSTMITAYPGCSCGNLMTQADAAKAYEAIGSGTLLKPATRSTLFASMPADAGDFGGELAGALAIIDDEASRTALTPFEVSLFKQQFDVHYKPGGDGCCTSSDCATLVDNLSVSGIATIPTCIGSTQSSAQYDWGLFINGGDSTATPPTFFKNSSEPLRAPIRDSLATWATCSAPAPGTTGATCSNNGNCHSFICTAGACQPASCAPSCNQGAPCGSNSDCGSGVCGTNGLCQKPACGPTCGPGSACNNNGDCSSFVCTNNRCAPPSCSPTCVSGAPCGTGADCRSGICRSTGRCQ